MIIRHNKPILANCTLRVRNEQCDVSKLRHFPLYRLTIDVCVYNRVGMATCCWKLMMSHREQKVRIEKTHTHSIAFFLCQYCSFVHFGGGYFEDVSIVRIWHSMNAAKISPMWRGFCCVTPTPPVQSLSHTIASNHETTSRSKRNLSIKSPLKTQLKNDSLETNPLYAECMSHSLTPSKVASFQRSRENRSRTLSPIFPHMLPIHWS